MQTRHDMEAVKRPADASLAFRRTFYILIRRM